MIEKQLYDTTEIATIFGLSNAFLRKLRSRQAGPTFVRIGERLVRYRLADVEKWLNTAAVEVQPRRAS
jgi:predicted DNA-binding transcriptional regulator AlpA